MAKQPQDFEKNTAFSNSFATSEKWQENWKKLEAENKQLLAQYMEDSSISPLSWLDMDLFNQENVENIFKQTMQSLTEQAGIKVEYSNQQFINIQTFLHSTLKKFQRELPKKSRNLKDHNKRKVDLDENSFFYLLHQSHLLNEQFLKEAVNYVDKIDTRIRRKLTFYTHHLVDTLSLSPHPLSSTDDLQGAIASMMSNPNQKVSHKEKKNVGKPSEIKGFELGTTLGTTSGKVVFQNDLFQLIQYEPLTKQVAKQPLLIVPPWANKYYIFDLTPQNSFIKWAIKSGLTVYVISWANPQDGENTLSDYVLHGLKRALDQVCLINSVKKVNMLGYCLGGTLLACLLGYLSAHKDSRVKSATFLATPFDFNKIDGLGIYRYEKRQPVEENLEIDDYLEGQYIIQVHNLLRANDLIWSSDVNHYLLGQEPFPYDMLYWVSDGLQLPSKMHTTYLRDILIENQLMQPGKLFIDDTPIHIEKVKTPLFIMAAEEDHIAPWMSVYALSHKTKSPLSKFILSGSGHLQGVFNHPDSKKYHFWMADSLPKDGNEWLSEAKKHSGSWWSAWRKWLEAFEGDQISSQPIPQKYILEKAPGHYALMDDVFDKDDDG